MGSLRTVSQYLSSLRRRSASLACFASFSASCCALLSALHGIEANGTLGESAFSLHTHTHTRTATKLQRILLSEQTTSDVCAHSVRRFRCCCTHSVLSLPFHCLLSAAFPSPLCTPAPHFPAAERPARALYACMKSIFRIAVLSSAVCCVCCMRRAQNVSVCCRRCLSAVLQQHGGAAEERA